MCSCLRCYVCTSPAVPVVLTDVGFWAALGWSLAEAAAELRVRHPWWPAVPAGLAAPALVALCIKVVYVRAQLYRPWYVDAQWNARVAIVPLVGALANTFTLAAWLFSLPYYVGELAADGVGVAPAPAHSIDTDVAAATEALMRRPSSVVLAVAYALSVCAACVAAAAHRRVLVAQLDAIDSVPLLDVIDDNDAYAGQLGADYDQPSFMGRGSSSTMTRAEMARAFLPPPRPHVPFVEVPIDESIDDVDSVHLSGAGDTTASLVVDNSRAPTRPPPVRPSRDWTIGPGIDDTSDAAVTSDAPLDSPRRSSRRHSRRKKKAS